MASYIGKIEITGVGAALVGSTLYGICGTPANTAIKDITANTNGSNNVITGDYVNTNYDNLVRGTTIHVKFIYGNTVDSGAKLLVGTVTTSQDVVGNFTCPPNTIISFTLDENQNWVVNDNVDTNTEYVFKTPYNASTNQVVGTADIGTAAEKDTVNALVDADHTITNNNIPTATAVVNYVLDKTAGLSGLTGAMHFRGETPNTDASNNPILPNSEDSFRNYDSGDVLLVEIKEYVYVKGVNAAASEWIELGDEGSYMLKSAYDEDTDITYLNYAANSESRNPVLSIGTEIQNINTSGSVVTGIADIAVTDQNPSVVVTGVTDTPLNIPAGTTFDINGGVLTLTHVAASTISAVTSSSITSKKLVTAPIYFDPGSHPSFTQTTVNDIVTKVQQQNAGG